MSEDFTEASLEAVANELKKLPNDGKLKVTHASFIWTECGYRFTENENGDLVGGWYVNKG